ncbi:MAG: T9SS type A sorting domain-containing protein [Flavobacteriales bacterium]|nr:T9SS type A sorting domain-containing protein [Flavobacteriales bacterium]
MVHGPALGSYRIELFNTIGSIIHAEWSTSERHELHIERLPAGIYWLRINEAVGFKVIKQ